MMQFMMRAWAGRGAQNAQFLFHHRKKGVLSEDEDLFGLPDREQDLHSPHCTAWSRRMRSKTPQAIDRYRMRIITISYSKLAFYCYGGNLARFIAMA